MKRGNRFQSLFALGLVNVIVVAEKGDGVVDITSSVFFFVIWGRLRSKGRPKENRFRPIREAHHDHPERRSGLRSSRKELTRTRSSPGRLESAQKEVDLFQVILFASDLVLGKPGF